MRWEVHLLTWTVVVLGAVVCMEVTVKSSDLSICEDDKRRCVTDTKDCQRTASEKNFNMSCYFLESVGSVTCGWSQVSHDAAGAHASLIFTRPRGDAFLSCIFNQAAVLNVSARFWTTVSRPQTLFLGAAVKPPPPVLTVDGTTSNSVTVTWRQSYEDGQGGECRLRYRAEDEQTWTEFPVSAPVRTRQTSVHVIMRLRPFTAYSAAVACRAESGIWSDWSPDVTVTTKETEPSKAPDVCYRVLRNQTDGSVLLHLMWEGLDIHDAGGRLLGYEVTKQTQVIRVQNSTELTLPLVVEDGNCSVTVQAFNSAGSGPAASISVDANAHNIRPSVRHLWASVHPSGKGLEVRWDAPKAPPSDPLPVSHFAVQWRSETRPSIIHWTRVGGAATNTLIPDVERDDSYLISVFPVYDHQCRHPRSLSASLKDGVLMEVVGLKVVGVTKTTVTVEWAWQRKTQPIRVQLYRLMLRRGSYEQMASVHLDQRQNTFLNLKPNSQYSLILLADHVSRNIITFRTDFDEIPTVAAVTPLLLFTLCVFIVSILSRTVYRWYFFAPISSPRGSTTGQWLMDPKQQDRQKPSQRNILDMDDFKVMDIAGDKSLIVVEPVLKPPSEEESLPSFSRLIIKLDPESNVPPPVSTQQRPDPRRSFHLDLDADRPVFDEVEEEETQRLTSHHHQTKTCRLFELLNPDRRCDAQSATPPTDGEMDASYLICENDYVSNSCFEAKEV